MEPHPLPVPLHAAVMLVAAATACAAATVLSCTVTIRGAGRAGRRSSTSLSVEQWLTRALRRQAESTGLPIAFIQDLLMDEDRESRAVHGHKDDAACPAGVVVLDRPYAKALAAQLEAVWSAGVWQHPPQVLNPELVALELDSSAERMVWTAKVISTLAHRLDETSACSLLATLGARGIASLLGQR